MLSQRRKRTILERVYRVRLENVRKIIQSMHRPGSDMGGSVRLARILGCTPPFITMIAGDRPIRTISETLAREIEVKLGLLPGYLDQIH